MVAERQWLQECIVFDGGVDLNTDLLLVLLETLKFDREQILARNEAREIISAFEIRDCLKGSMSQSLATEIHDNARKRSALVRYISNDFAPDTSALCRSANSDKKGDYYTEGSGYSLIHER